MSSLTDGHGQGMSLDSLNISIQRFWVLKKNIQSKFYFFCSSKRVSIQLLSYICFSEVNKRRWNIIKISKIDQDLAINSLIWMYSRFYWFAILEFVNVNFTLCNMLVNKQNLLRLDISKNSLSSTKTVDTGQLQKKRHEECNHAKHFDQLHIIHIYILGKLDNTGDRLNKSRFV